jgi:trimethylamine--corrinoid protein Co-methyltransferase
MKIHEPVGGQLEILSRSDIEKIHGATVEVLRRLGIKVWEPHAFDLFKDAGADTDKKTKMVRIPESLLKETIRKAPSEFYMYGRDPKYRLRMGAKRVHFSLAGQTVKVHDLNGLVRDTVMKDTEDVAKLGDHCEYIHHISLGTTPKDVPDEVHGPHHIWANWRNSVKTTDGYNYGTKLSERTLEMLSILRGGKEEMMRMPTLLGFTNPVSPMQLSTELLQGAMIYSMHNQPMLYAPEALAGGTAPVTLAGLLVQQNAEVLSGIMVSQMVRPGSPVLYGTVSAAMDMKTGSPALGGPEVGLINVAAAQLARHYSLPCRGTGGNTDSKVNDMQAGYESSTTLLMAALAGMNFIYDAAGSLEGSLTMSLEKIVMDNELCGMISKTLSGIDISEESLAIDEIFKAGPSASHLGTPFTRSRFRSELFIPSLLDRRSRDSWSKDGGKDMQARAREEARRILKEHQPEPVERSVASDLEKFLKRIDKEAGRSA